MHMAGLPIPDLQTEILTDRGMVRVDFEWADLGLVGEFDGMIKYGRLRRPGQSVEEVLQAEKNREAALMRTGRWLVRWTARDLGDVAAFGAKIRKAMAAAGRRRAA